MRSYALMVLLLVSACSGSPRNEVLAHRLAGTMTLQKPCTGQAGVEYLPDGARVMLPDTELFVVGRTDISPCGQYALASVVEAMLDPSIMQIVIEPGGDINAPEAFMPRERAASLQTTLSKITLLPVQPPVLVQPAPVPTGRLWGIVLTFRS